MSNTELPDYTWDGSGKIDGEAEKLEKTLGPLGAGPPSTPPRKRGWIAASIIAGLTFCFVFLATSPHRVPAQVAGLLSDAETAIDVEGGSRVEFALFGPDTSLEMTQRVAAQLRKRGAEISSVEAGRVVVDIPGVLPLEIEAWTTGVGAYGEFSMSIVLEDTELMQRVFAQAERDNRALALGVRPDTESWRHDDTGRRFRDYYLEANDEDALKTFLRELGEQHPPLRPEGGARFLIEEVFSFGDQARFRSYLVSTEKHLTERDIADATVASNPTTGRPEVIVEFTESGGRKFGELTGKNVGRKLAIILDRRVMSAPTIQSRIDGGSSSITMGSLTSFAAAFAEAEGLAGALRGGPLAAQLERTRTVRVEPVIAGGALETARMLFALPFALIAFLIIMVIARWVPEIRPTVFRLGQRESGRQSSVVTRSLVTAGGALAAALTFYVPLPRVNVNELRYLGESAIGDGTYGFGAFALGLAPVFTAFVLVELAALAVPAWRRLRVGGPTARSRLGQAIAVCAVFFAAVQAWVIARFLVTPGEFGNSFVEAPSMEAEIIIATTLIGGTMSLVVLASLVSRYGLGNGYIAVILGATGFETFFFIRDVLDLELPASEIGALVVLILGVAGITSAVLRLRVGGESPWNRFHLPTCGLVPIVWVISVSLAATQFDFFADAYVYGTWLRMVSDSVNNSWGFVALAAGLAVGLSFLFSRPVRFDASIKVVGKSNGDAMRFFWIATAASTAVIVVLAALYHYSLGNVPVGPLDGLGVALITAGIMDVVADFRAHRRNGNLVAVWPMHRVQLVDAALDALATHGIDAHAHGLNVRKLFFFFAPFVPILIMVPEDKSSEAMETLETLIGRNSSASVQDEPARAS